MRGGGFLIRKANYSFGCESRRINFLESFCVQQGPFNHNCLDCATPIESFIYGVRTRLIPAFLNTPEAKDRLVFIVARSKELHLTLPGMLAVLVQ